MSARRVLLAVLALIAVSLGLVRLWIERLEPAAGAADTARVRAEGESADAPEARIEAPDTVEAERHGRALPGADRGRASVTRSQLASVHGRVVDAEGHGIAGAELTLALSTGAPGERADFVEIQDFSSRIDPNGRYSRTAWSDALVPVHGDAEGRFEANELTPGTWRLDARAAGHESAYVELGTLAGGTRRDDVVVELVRTPRTRVSVTWPDGTAADGVLLTLAIDPRPGQDVESKRESAMRTWRRGGTGGDETDNVAGVHAGMTDARGTAEVGVPQCGAWTLAAHGGRRIASEQGRAVPAEVDELLRGESRAWVGVVNGVWPPPAEVRIVLAPRACVLGRVVDARGTPIADVRVDTWREEGDRGRSVGSARTNARGVYLFQDLPAARLTLVAAAGADYAWCMREFETSTDLQRIDLVLPRCSVLAGVVRDARGAPRAGVRVGSQWFGEETPSDGIARVEQQQRVQKPLWGPHSRLERMITPPVTNKHAITDEGGRFKIEQIPPGWVRVTTLVQDALPSTPLDVVVTAGEDQLELKLFLRVGASIEGRVLDKDGARLAARIVHFFREGDEEHAESALTDAGGAFRLQRLDPGRWVFQLQPDDEPADDASGAGEKPAKKLLTQTVDASEGAVVRVLLAPE